MINKVLFLSILLLIISCDGSVNPNNEVYEFEGTWTGTEIDPVNTQNFWTFISSDNSIQILGPTEQLTGTFTVNTSVSPKEVDLQVLSYLSGGEELPQYQNTTCLGIYKFEQDTLYMANSEPGSSIRPITFEAGLTPEFNFQRLFVLTKQ